MNLTPCTSPAQRPRSPSHLSEESLDCQSLTERIQQYYMQQQRLKQLQDEERKKRQQAEKSAAKKKSTSAAVLQAAANAGRVAIGPIPLEVGRSVSTATPSPLPPFPSPTSQRKEAATGNQGAYEKNYYLTLLREIDFGNSRITENYINFDAFFHH